MMREIKTSIQFIYFFAMHLLISNLGIINPAYWIFIIVFDLFLKEYFSFL